MWREYWRAFFPALILFCHPSGRFRLIGSVAIFPSASLLGKFIAAAEAGVTGGGEKELPGLELMGLIYLLA
jgi:hypothetical protein